MCEPFVSDIFLSQFVILVDRSVNLLSFPILLTELHLRLSLYVSGVNGFVLVHSTRTPVLIVSRSALVTPHEIRNRRVRLFTVGPITVETQLFGVHSRHRGSSYDWEHAITFFVPPSS
jgi:hypothetical protein